MSRCFVLIAMVLTVAVGQLTGDQPQQPYHVMVANDDGINAPGIAAIVAVLAADPAYRVTVVAPAEQQSVSSQSHVTRREVPVREHDPIAGAAAWSVGATPASVVRIGLTALLADDPPDLVISGINRGENDGLGAWTSGTVGAAREAALIGFASVALSLQLDWDDPKPDFEGAARWCKPLIDAIKEQGVPPGVVLNVNVPRDIETIRGYRLARMGLTPPALAKFDPVREEAGATWYRSRWRPPAEAASGTDTKALHEGWVAIAPLQVDQTNYTAFPVLQGIEALPLPARESVVTSSP